MESYLYIWMIIGAWVAQGVGYMLAGFALGAGLWGDSEDLDEY